MNQTNPQEVRLKGAPNFRDLGGYVTTNGRRVRLGRLYRSEGLHQLTEDDFEILRELGLRQVCDLRSDLEREQKPTVWPEHLVPDTLVMDVNADIRAGKSDLWQMLRDDPSEAGVLAMIMHVYRFVPDALTRHLSRFFNVVTQDDGLPLVLHCSAGKDRTGVLSAILLLTLGVSRETVVDDYMKTHVYRDAPKLEQKVRELMEPILGMAPPQRTIEIMAGVHPSYLEASLHAIESQYGTIEAYLVAAGVSKEQINQFQAQMLDA